MSEMPKALVTDEEVFATWKATPLGGDCIAAVAAMVNAKYAAHVAAAVAEAVAKIQEKVQALHNGEPGTNDYAFGYRDACQDITTKLIAAPRGDSEGM